MFFKSFFWSFFRKKHYATYYFFLKNKTEKYNWCTFSLNTRSFNVRMKIYSVNQNLSFKEFSFKCHLIWIFWKIIFLIFLFFSFFICDRKYLNCQKKLKQQVLIRIRSYLQPPLSVSNIGNQYAFFKRCIKLRENSRIDNNHIIVYKSDH